MEYTGQLRGGPDDGNLVTSTERVFAFKATYASWLDGLKEEPVVVNVRGTYTYVDVDRGGPFFRWERTSTTTGLEPR
jgi:hypothetical protein